MKTLIIGPEGPLERDMTPEEVGEMLAQQSGAPTEVAMHKVQKAALLTTWPGAENLQAAIEAAIDQLPSPSNRLARIEWDKAPNLVREGATTLAVMQLLGMTEGARDDLLTFAASLP